VPELPEVETARRLAARVAVGRRIVDVWCAADPIVFETAPPRVRAALKAAAWWRPAVTASTCGSRSTAGRGC